MNRQFEREEEILEKELADGSITYEEFKREIRELRLSFQAAA